VLEAAAFRGCCEEVIVKNESRFLLGMLGPNENAKKGKITASFSRGGILPKRVVG
jgi:hypothetical protein